MSDTSEAVARAEALVVRMQDIKALANAAPHSSLHLQRVWRAAKALSAYAEIWGEHDLGDMFTDLLADLGHLADAAGVDFADAIEKGTFHLDVEREENE